MPKRTPRGTFKYVRISPLSKPDYIIIEYFDRSHKMLTPEEQVILYDLIDHLGVEPIELLEKKYRKDILQDVLKKLQRKRLIEIQNNIVKLSPEAELLMRLIEILYEDYKPKLYKQFKKYIFYTAVKRMGLVNYI